MLQGPSSQQGRSPQQLEVQPSQAAVRQRSQRSTKPSDSASFASRSIDSLKVGRFVFCTTCLPLRLCVCVLVCAFMHAHAHQNAATSGCVSHQGLLPKRPHGAWPPPLSI